MRFFLARRALPVALALVALLSACAGESIGTPPTASPTAPPTAAIPEAIITVERAPVFPVPDRNAEPFTYLYQQEHIAIAAQNDDGSFLQVTVEERDGWILRAQVAISGDLAQVAVAAAPSTEEPTPSSDNTNPNELTSTAIIQTNTAIAVNFGFTQTAAQTAFEASQTAASSTESARTATPAATDMPVPTQNIPAPTATDATPAEAAFDVTPGSAQPTRTPLPTRTPVPDASPSDLPVAPGEPPPLDITLPDGWQAAHAQIPFSTFGGVRDMPLTIYRGPLADDVTGIIYLFWGFPNVVTPNGALNLWADGVQILRGSLIGDACNLGVYEQRTFTVGGQSGVGAFYQADECEEQTNTAGWFVALRVGNTSFAFYTAVEPLAAMPDQVAALQAILDSVAFGG